MVGSWRRWLAVVLLGSALQATAWAEGLGLEGRFRVTAVVADYQPTRHHLGVRVTVERGLTLEYETEDARDVETILAMVASASERGTHLYVVVEADSINSFQLAAGGGS